MFVFACSTGIEWGILTATFEGASKKQTTGGDSWAFIVWYFEQFMYCLYPSEERGVLTSL